MSDGNTLQCSFCNGENYARQQPPIRLVESSISDTYICEYCLALCDQWLREGFPMEAA